MTIGAHRVAAMRHRTDRAAPMKLGKNLTMVGAMRVGAGSGLTTWVADPDVPQDESHAHH